MPTFVPSSVNNVGVNNVDTLAQNRVYAGEVMSAFVLATTAERYVTAKTLVSGESMKFPIVGVGKKEDVLTHVIGTDITINTKQAGEVVIGIGDLEYDSVFIDNKQAKILDYDQTAPFTRNLGQSLADKLDFSLYGLLRLAVVADGVSGQPDGSYIENAGIATALTQKAKGNLLVESIFSMNAIMDTNGVPKENRVFVTTPANWWAIGLSDNIRSKDFQTSNGGIDSFNGEHIMVGNTRVIQSTNLTLTNAFEGYLFTPDAIGLVKLISVITESSYQELKFGNVITARYCYGKGILNAGCVVGLRSSIVAIP